MGFELKKKETAAAGIRRVAREEIEDSLEILEEKSADPEETVHELRKHFKRIRAVLRLVRDEVGDTVYRRDNGAVRDLGRRLASARNASVRASALDRLCSAYEKDLLPDRVAPIVKALASRRRSALARLQRGSSFSSISRELESLRARVRTWPARREGFSCLEPGLRLGYRQGRTAEAKAYATREDDAFHEWRKRAKDLRYHVELLAPAWPETMKDMENTLHALTDRLGDDHDFADLRRALTASPKIAREDGVPIVIERIDRRRSELQAAARPLGARIYAEKPRAFGRRMGSYWEAWRSCPDE